MRFSSRLSIIFRSEIESSLTVNDHRSIDSWFISERYVIRILFAILWISITCHNIVYDHKEVNSSTRSYHRLQTISSSISSLFLISLEFLDDSISFQHKVWHSMVVSRILVLSLGPRHSINRLLFHRSPVIIQFTTIKK